MPLEVLLFVFFIVITYMIFPLRVYRREQKRKNQTELDKRIRKYK